MSKGFREHKMYLVTNDFLDNPYIVQIYQTDAFDTVMESNKNAFVPVKVFSEQLEIILRDGKKISFANNKILVMLSPEAYISAVQHGANLKNVIFVYDSYLKRDFLTDVFVPYLQTYLKHLVLPNNFAENFIDIKSDKFKLLAKTKFHSVIGTLPIENNNVPFLSYLYGEVVKQNCYLALVLRSRYFFPIIRNNKFTDNPVSMLYHDNVLCVQLDIVDYYEEKDRPQRRNPLNKGYFVIKKTLNNTIHKTMLKNKEDIIIDLDLGEFVTYNGKWIVPRGLTSEYLPIYRKIKKYNNKIYSFHSYRPDTRKSILDFKDSAVVGFANVKGARCDPKYCTVLYDNCRLFSARTNYCVLDKPYAEKNIYAIFCGKIFAFMLYVCCGSWTSQSASIYSFFPHVDLTKHWTFDKLSAEFGFSEKEKQIILKWPFEINDSYKARNWKWKD